MSDTILITGGTGFLGMQSISTLLAEDDGPELLLAVRAADRAGAAERIGELLGKLYDDVPASARRLRGIPAELTSSALGLSSADRREVVTTVDRVVHCAASISFTLPLAEARTINVEGTRSLLDLARDIPGVERVVHVSTAYVAGYGGGRFAESDLDRGQAFRNTYEQTKWEAEALVRAADDLPVVVVRPSIVVGESGSGWTAAFNVIYWPLQAFARGLLQRVPANPDGLVDLVPVDHVADVVLQAALAPDVDGTLHAVAGERALRVRDLVAYACEALDQAPLQLTAPGTLDPDDPAAIFAPYFDVQVAFDDRRTREITGRGAPAAEEFLPALFDYAKTARWGRKPLTRQAARERMAVAAA